MGDLLGSLPRKPQPELLQVLLLPPLAHKQELGPPRPIQGMHRVLVALPPPHRHLVDADGGDPLQGPDCLGRLDGTLVQRLDGPGVKPQEQGDGRVRQDLADTGEAVYAGSAPAGRDPGPQWLGIDKVSIGKGHTYRIMVSVIQRRAYGLRDEECLRLKILTCMLSEI